MRIFTARQWRVIGVTGVIALLVMFRVYVSIVPWGVQFYPWVLASVEGSELRSPDGSSVVQVYFNDAGAAHSGNHWTWIVTNSWLFGRRVVAQGYQNSDVRTGKNEVPLIWKQDGQFTVRFLPKRYQTSIIKD